jgi:hypothetical protein
LKKKHLLLSITGLAVLLVIGSTFFPRSPLPDPYQLANVRRHFRIALALDVYNSANGEYPLDFRQESFASYIDANDMTDSRSMPHYLPKVENGKATAYALLGSLTYTRPSRIPLFPSTELTVATMATSQGTRSAEYTSSLNRPLLMVFILLLPIGFLLMSAGYFLLIRRVWHRPDRGAQIKAILTSSKPQEWQREPRIGGALIVIGALCGAVGCLGLVAVAFL